MTLLKLDFDGELPDEIMYRINWTLDIVGLKASCVRIDRTRRGYHVLVALVGRVNDYTVVCLQAVLGSDPKRETFNLMRVRNLRNVTPFWRARWNVLYARHNRGKNHAVVKARA